MGNIINKEFVETGNEIINLKYMKNLGAGLFGTVYLVKYNGQKYTLKVQPILSKHREKSFKYGIWRELDIYKFIDTLNDEDKKFFTVLYIYNIYDNCKHKQVRNITLNIKNKLHKNLLELDKSDWCVNYLIDYKGKTTLYEHMINRNISSKNLHSILLQLIKIILLLYEDGYYHNDLHFNNIMIQKTDVKYFILQGRRKKYNGYQLSLIDYGRVLHKKYKNISDSSFQQDLNDYKKDSEKYIFEDIYYTILNLSVNMLKYFKMLTSTTLYNSTEYTKKKNAKILKKIYKNHDTFWIEATQEYIELYPENKLFFEKIFNSNIDKILTNYDARIWSILTRIYYKFIVCHPKLFSRYSRLNTYSLVKIDNEHIYNLLKITNYADLINYILENL